MVKIGCRKMLQYHSDVVRERTETTTAMHLAQVLTTVN